MAHEAPSSIPYKWSYDVFLSYSRVDTHISFSSPLCRALRQKGLRVFLDDGVIREVDSSRCLNAARESRIVIIVFSENYSDSIFWLQELKAIIECFNRWTFPVFYDEDSSGLHHKIWGLLLTKAAALPVYHFLPRTMKLHECIGEIVERVTTLTKEKEEGEEEHDDKKKKEGEEKEQDDKKKKEGEEEQDDKKKKEGEEEEHDDKKNKEEEGNDDTILETTNLSFWEKKERIESYNVLLRYCEAKQFDFPSLLSDSLRQGGLSVYHAPIINSITLNEEITDKSSKALPKSRIVIIVFSKNYTDSVYGLEELEQILESFNFKGEGQLIYPVFYHVDPFEALARLEKRFIDKRDQVEEWMRALSRLADLPGYHDQVEEWRRVSQPDDLPGYHFLPRTMNVDECIGVTVERVTAWMNEEDKFWVWDKGEKIGYGAHGNVYVARHWKTRAICGAIKELNIYKVDAGYACIQKEIKFLSKLEEHPNIVKYYDNKDEGDGISLYMEYIQPGSLQNYIQKRGKLKAHMVQDFTAQILFGLVHLQNNKQVHRDLKPANLLVDSKNIVKLVDFGLAKLLEKSSGKHSVEGTKGYAAPEVDGKLNYHRSHEALAADIWSLGCVIIEMSSGSPPTWSASDLRPRIPEELCQEGKEFLKRCLKIEPAERPSAEELLKDPFVKAQVDSLKNTGLYKD